MRIESTASSVSWIPSESLTGPLALGMDLGVSHFDEPPPDVLEDADHLRRLRDADAYRFANLLAAWADVEDDRIVAAGFAAQSGLLMGSTFVGTPRLEIAFQGVSLPVLRPEPEVGPDQVRFTQTVGGRTGVPLPRPVAEPPYVQWQAPTVWTTLALTLHADGHAAIELAGASAFPRHWVYGPDGTLTQKSAVTDQTTWMRHSFGRRTPWGDQDSPVLVSDVESRLEHQMSYELMRAGREPEVRRLPRGAVLVRQGDPGDELFLLLDGVLAVEVNGERVAELGPGAVLGERAILEGGRRTSTVSALTPVRVAVAGADAVDPAKLRALARSHDRENAPQPGNDPG